MSLGRVDLVRKTYFCRNILDLIVKKEHLDFSEHLDLTIEYLDLSVEYLDLLETLIFFSEYLDLSV